MNLGMWEARRLAVAYVRVCEGGKRAGSCIGWLGGCGYVGNLNKVGSGMCGCMFMFGRTSALIAQIYFRHRLKIKRKKYNFQKRRLHLKIVIT